MRLRSNLFSTGRYIATTLLSAVAPPRCMGCLKEMTWLCSDCRKKVGNYTQNCIVCEKPHPRGITCNTCKEHSVLTGVVSVGNYRSQLLQRGIGWLKFKSIQSVAQPLATLLLPKLEFVAPITQLQSDGVLVPIPLHPRRQKERGFNQALEIAQALSQYTGIRVIEALARNRATWVQSHLPTELRAQNVENVFTQTQDISDYSKIIIIDDVATSGATLNAAAHALALPSSAQIWACTIARG